MVKAVDANAIAYAKTMFRGCATGICGRLSVTVVETANTAPTNGTPAQIAIARLVRVISSVAQSEAEEVPPRVRPLPKQSVHYAGCFCIARDANAKTARNCKS